MLRLELEAQVANLQAEAGAMAAEAAVESGMPIEMPPTCRGGRGRAADAAPPIDARRSTLRPAADRHAADKPTV